MYRRILVPIDFSEPSLRLVDLAAQLAKTFDAEVFVMHVDEEETMFGLHSSDDIIRFFRDIELRRDTWMERICADVTDQGLVCSQVRAKGAASEEILRVAEEQNIDIIMMATVGLEGMKRILIGSTAKKVLRNALCPVLTINAAHMPPETWSIRKILYPFDSSDAAHAGVSTAVDLASKFDATIEMLKVLKIPTLIPSLPGEPPISLPQSSVEYMQSNSESELAEVANRFSAASFLTAVTIGSDEAESIADYAKSAEADLIVMPRGGESVLSRFFFGRVAHGVVKLATVPVLSLPITPKPHKS